MPSLLSRLLGKKKKNADQSPLSDGEQLEAVPRTQHVYPDLTFLKPPGIVPRLPDDVWRQIAQYIPGDELKGLLEINASLFHLAMDARYRTVVLWDFNHAVHGNLQRLRDPAVAPRVRKLRVDMLNYPQRSHTTLADTRLLASTEPGPVENHVEIFKDTCIACSKSEAIIKAMVDTVCCFSKVVDFSISWRDPGRAPYDEEFLPFLTAAWSTFGSQLRKVDLGVPLGQLQTLLCTSGRLDALEELQIEVRCLATTHQNDVLASTVAPFINRSALNLRSLSILFDGDPTYSSWLNSLEEMPKLESLTLRMIFDSYGFSDERGLTRILRNHAATLRHVSWTSPHARDWFDFSTLVEWMTQNQFDESILCNLRTLQIMVPPGPVAFGLTMGYIARSADTLTSLRLSGASLTSDQANIMMSIFTHRGAGRRPYFQELSIQVDFLSPDMVSTMAQVFPCLGVLALGAWSVSGSERDVLVRPEWRAEELAYAREFAEEIRSLDIRGWRLHDIGLTTSCYTVGLDIKLMRVFAECVPSIKYFWGMDKELVPLETDNYYL